MTQSKATPSVRTALVVTGLVCLLLLAAVGRARAQGSSNSPGATTPAQAQATEGALQQLSAPAGQNPSAPTQDSFKGSLVAGQSDRRSSRPLAGRRHSARPAPEPRPDPADHRAAERQGPAVRTVAGAAANRYRRRFHRGRAGRSGRVWAEVSRSQSHHRPVPGDRLPRLSHAEPGQRARAGELHRSETQLRGRQAYRAGRARHGGADGGQRLSAVHCGRCADRRCQCGTCHAARSRWTRPPPRTMPAPARGWMFCARRWITRTSSRA